MTFHLAIPMNPELREATKEFYDNLCKLVHECDGYLIFDFYGTQLVCHANEKCDVAPEIYPRHFGVNFDRYDEWLQMYEAWQDCDWLFQKVISRFPGTDRAHVSFMVKDPSNNVLEFKHYFAGDQI